MTSMEDTIRTLLQKLSENPHRTGLRRTPQRWLEAMALLTSGYQQSPETVIKGALTPAEGSDLILLRDIEFYSLCEHHLLPFFGRAHIAYLPGEHIIGLSKIPRIVDVYARRLQTQERLTKQIAVALTKVLHPKGVAVLLEAQHLCMMMRGVGKQHTTVTTSAFTGVFRRSPKRQKEFVQLLSPKRSYAARR